MGDVKWIKISTDIFDNWKIKQIKAMPEGHKMVCVWFQLLCLCGKCNESGLIVLSGKVVANDELLSNIFGEDLKIIQLSLKTFEAFGMIEITTDGVTKVSNWDEYQNAEGLEKIKKYERDRKASQRQKSKAIEASDDASSKSVFFSPSKSNAKNLDYILNAYSDEYKSIIDDHELLEAVKGWMEYKDQKKPTKQNHYDTEIGIKRFLKQVLNVYQKYGTYSTISVIDESMANNYMGVMWDRAGKLKGPHNSVFDEWRNA